MQLYVGFFMQPLYVICMQILYGVIKQASVDPCLELAWSIESISINSI